MNLRLVVRFMLVLFSGVVLVWIFGVQSGEDLLGRRVARERAEGSASTAAVETSANGEPRADVSLTDAVIPVREALEDDPSVHVLKYTISIGATKSGPSKRMPAEDVRIDIYNKKPKPDERVVARVHGDRATLLFLTPPDVTGGFRDAAIDAMTLYENVLVEYLDEAGRTMTTLETAELDLSDQSFRSNARCTIRQEGLEIHGDGLAYDKKSGSFSFEKNVFVEGTRFGLPDETSGRDPSETGVAPAPETVRTITCDGRFTFVPDEPAEAGDPGGDGGNEGSSHEQLASIGGGVLTFRDRVVGKQAGSTLNCELLEISLDKAAPRSNGEATDEDEDASLDISQVVATGTAARPAVLVDARGTIRGETLTLVKTDDGQVLTVVGDPQIADARLGDDGTIISAGAKREIRLRPKPVTQDVATNDPDPGSDVAMAERTVLELRVGAFLETKSAAPENDFRIDGDEIDVEFARAAPPDEGPAATSSLELLGLRSTGGARGTFAGGGFTGDVIEATPVASGGGTSQFQIDVFPNPVVRLDTPPAKEGQKARAVVIRTEDGKLTYTPPDAPSDPTHAVFTGATTLTMREGDALLSTLTAQRTMTIEMTSDADETGLAALVAEGDVHFDSVEEGVVGDGDRLTLVPTSDGRQRVVLSGRPAIARTIDPSTGTPDKRVAARSITFDPETGRLHAVEEVEALAGLKLSVEGPGAAHDEGPPGVLKCDELELLAREGTETILVATSRVVFDDPAKGLVAQGSRLVYRESQGFATLHGDGERFASVTRTEAGADGAAESRHVTIHGPTIVLDQQTGSLHCPAAGTVTLVRPKSDTQKELRVVARSVGPIRYENGRLILTVDVAIGFAEDDRETRALLCDQATVLFAEASDGESANGMGGLDKIIAVGRVHMEQTEPRALIAEGQRLEWTLLENDEEIFLSGSDPQCWVVGLLGDRDVRDEADWFRLRKNSEEVQAENGHTVFVDQITWR